jgi:phage terminase small subunit
MTTTPRGLRATGKRLCEAVTCTFDLDPPEAALLEEACPTRDLLADLRAEIARNPAVIDSSQGVRVHPAIVEARQQRLVMAKLLTGLGLPRGLVDDEDGAA